MFRDIPGEKLLTLQITHPLLCLPPGFPAVLGPSPLFPRTDLPSRALGQQDKRQGSKMREKQTKLLSDTVRSGVTTM